MKNVLSAADLELLNKLNHETIGVKFPNWRAALMFSFQDGFEIWNEEHPTNIINHESFSKLVQKIETLSDIDLKSYLQKTENAYHEFKPSNNVFAKISNKNNDAVNINSEQDLINKLHAELYNFLMEKSKDSNYIQEIKEKMAEHPFNFKKCETSDELLTFLRSKSNDTNVELLADSVFIGSAYYMVDENDLEMTQPILLDLFEQV